jgi:tight adherence protein B
LQRLAARAGGEYSGVTSPSELSRIYGALGARFSRQYLVQYRSFAGPKKRVRVVLTIDGGREAARTGYMTPALAVTAAPVFRHSLWDRFWASTLTMILVGFAVALLVVLAIVGLIRPRRGTLRKRLAQFVSLPMRDDGKKQGPLSSRVLVGAERSLEGTRFWARFKEHLELAEIHIPPAQIAVATAVLTLLAMLVFYMVFPPLALVGLGVPFGVRALILKKVSHRRKAFAEQLPDNLQVLSSALRAGHSFVGALSVVVDDASEPARSEFRRVVGDEQLGVPLEDAIDAVRRRMDNRDLEQVSLVAAMQRQTGGNMAEVLDRVTETIRERFELRRMVKTLTAQGRLSRWIVTAIPVVLLLVISAMNPQYMQPLFVEPMGRVLLVSAGVFCVLGSYVIGRIVDIEV